MTFWQALGSIIVYIIMCFIESIFIGTAITAFKKRQYYAFGFNLSLAIGQMIFIIKHFIYI